MASLKTARLAANDLFSTYPNGQGQLESDLCTIFGFTPNTDITAAAIQFDNSGRVTTALIPHVVVADTYSPGPGPTTLEYGVGHQITNTTNSKVAIVEFESDGGDPRFVVKDFSDGATYPERLALDISSGVLTGYVTQDLSSTPLVPASGGSASSYYDGTGNFSIPGGAPAFDGCSLLPLSLTLAPSSSGYMEWTEASPGFDVGNHFNSGTDDTKFITTTAGKYIITVQLASYISVGQFLNANVELELNGATVLSKAFIYSDATDSHATPLRFINMSTVVNLSNTAWYLKVKVTNNDSTSTIVSGLDNGDVSHVYKFNGRFYATRVE